MRAEHRAQLLADHPHRAIIEVAERVYNAEHDFLEGKVPNSTGLWQQVANLLIARTLQLQRSLLDGVTLGYDEELQPTARGMMGTVVTVRVIGHGRRLNDRHRKALRYLSFGRTARQKQLRYLARSHWITRADRIALDAQETAAEEDLLQRAQREGLTPLCIGPQRNRSWHGYTDRDLFKRMGLLRWYHHFYARWSDESHAQPAALVQLSEQLADKGAFEIGPHVANPGSCFSPFRSSASRCSSR